MLERFSISGNKTTKVGAMILNGVQSLIVPSPCPPFSKKQLKLMQFRQNLDQCSADQKLMLMVLMMLNMPLISKENDTVCNAYNSANNSFFLRSWQYKTRKIDFLLFWNQYHDSISQLHDLFIQMEPLERGQLIYQLLLISKKSVLRETIIIYNYFFLWLVPNNKELKTLFHLQETDKHSLILELSHSSLILTQRIFFLHQHLEMQIVEHFQKMLNQMTLYIDLELERLLQVMISPLVQDDDVNIAYIVETVEDYDSDATVDLDNDTEDDTNTYEVVEQLPYLWTFAEVVVENHNSDSVTL